MPFDNRVPRTLEDQFREHHIDLVFKELHERFSLNVKFWKEQYQSKLRSQPRHVDEVGYFLKFCNQYINPLLNSLLGRYDQHPTFNKLVEYVMRKGY